MIDVKIDCNCNLENKGHYLEYNEIGYLSNLKIDIKSLLTIYNLTQWTHTTSVIIAIIDIKNPFNVMKDILNHFSAKSSRRFFETEIVIVGILILYYV